MLIGMSAAAVARRRVFHLEHDGLLFALMLIATMVSFLCFAVGIFWSLFSEADAMRAKVLFTYKYYNYFCLNV
jgi:hypothetical protein